MSFSKDCAPQERGAVEKAKTCAIDSTASGGRVKENSVTASATCYIIRCAGCGLLEQTTRSDSLTCSLACRVLGHRNGATETVRRMAKIARVTPGMIVRCQAILCLRPDLGERIRRGDLEIDDAETRREMAAAFWALVMSKIGLCQSADGTTEVRYAES